MSPLVCFSEKILQLSIVLCFHFIARPSTSMEKMEVYNLYSPSVQPKDRIELDWVKLSSPGKSRLGSAFFFL